MPGNEKRFSKTTACLERNQLKHGGAQLPGMSRGSTTVSCLQRLLGAVRRRFHQFPNVRPFRQAGLVGYHPSSSWLMQRRSDAVTRAPLFHHGQHHCKAGANSLIAVKWLLSTRLQALDGLSKRHRKAGLGDSVPCRSKQYYRNLLHQTGHHRAQVTCCNLSFSVVAWLNGPAAVDNNRSKATSLATCVLYVP